MNKNKNILYSISDISGYKESVFETLSRLFNRADYIKDYLPSKENRNLYFKMLREISKYNGFIDSLYKKELKKYFNQLLDKYSGNYDYFLVIGGGEFTEDFIKELKKRNKNIKCILYFWDKYEYASIRRCFNFFDEVYTFDPEDAKKYNFKFFPTFYIDDCLKELIDFRKRTLDLYYIGSYKDKNRYIYIKSFEEYCIKNNINYFLKLVTHNIKNFKIENNDRNILRKKLFDYHENLKMLKNSKVVIDLPPKNQQGLTLRCFEAIATDTKVITTNSDIKNYDFFSEENIYVIDNLNDIDKIPLEFFNIPPINVHEKIKKKYTEEYFIKYLIEN